VAAASYLRTERHLLIRDCLLDQIVQQELRGHRILGQGAGREGPATATSAMSPTTARIDAPPGLRTHPLDHRR
jgi:hypothetical protein